MANNMRYGYYIAPKKEVHAPITLEQYNEIREYCSKHKWTLLRNAQPGHGKKVVSVAEQVAEALKLPVSVEFEDTIRTVTYDW